MENGSHPATRAELDQAMSRIEALIQGVGLSTNRAIESSRNENAGAIESLRNDTTGMFESFRKETASLIEALWQDSARAITASELRMLEHMDHLVKIHVADFTKFAKRQNARWTVTRLTLHEILSNLEELNGRVERLEQDRSKN